MTEVAYASKEIIISAGAMNSPKILLQSGIGPADELEDLDVIKSDERKTFQSLRFFSTAFLFPLCFED